MAAWELRAEAAVYKARRLQTLQLQKKHSNVTALSEQTLQKIHRLLLEGVKTVPDDPQPHWRLANWHVWQYRLKTARRLLESRPELKTLEAAWPLTDLLVLHKLARDLQRLGDQQGLQDLRNSELVQRHLVPAFFELLQARRNCPMLAYVHLMLGKLDVVVCDGSHESQDLRRVLRVRPGRADWVFEAGFVAWQSSDWDTALKLWKHCLEISAKQDSSIALLVSSDKRLAERFDELLPDRPDVLVRLALGAFAGSERKPFQLHLFEKIERLLSRRDGALTALEHFALAEAAAHLGKPEVADVHFSQAVAGAPPEEKERWLLEYADFLRRQRRWDKAIQFYQMARLISSRPEKYDKLIEQTRRERIEAFRRKAWSEVRQGGESEQKTQRPSVGK